MGPLRFSFSCRRVVACSAIVAVTLLSLLVACESSLNPQHPDPPPMTTTTTATTTTVATTTTTTMPRDALATHGEAPGR